MPRRSERRTLSRAASLALAAWLVCWPQNGSAAGAIRDAEIESLLRSYSEPLMQAAGLAPEQVKFFLINERSINAFVAGGQNLFLNTGLIAESKTPNMLIGVIAHELGHISGGHLSRTEPERTKAGFYAAAAWILGLGTILAGAGADVGSALLLGGAQLGQRSYLQYSRTQEAAADQAALSLLDATRQSPRGLIQFLEKFAADFEYLTADERVSLDPYALTHPLPRSRINALQRAAAASRWADTPDTPEHLHRHAMIHAKIAGFLDPPKRVFASWPASDTSQPARYARTIAHFKSSNLPDALRMIRELSAEEPDNPWFHELHGQILFESGDAARAIAPYQTSVRLRPQEPLLYIGLAAAQTATEEPALVTTAIGNLRRALRYEPDNATALFQLATAYGHLGKTAHAQLALAEYYARLNRMGDARRQATRARSSLPKGSPEWLRADDILRIGRAPAPRR